MENALRNERGLYLIGVKLATCSFEGIVGKLTAASYNDTQIV